MSSSDDEAHQSAVNGDGLDCASGAKNKKRKITRACDYCRRRKTKCDASNKDVGEKCTPCILYSRDCTFIESAKRRGPPKGYMEFLESRVDRLEDALRKLAPNFNIGQEIGPRYTPASWEQTSQDIKQAQTRASPNLPAAVKPNLQTSPPPITPPTPGGLRMVSPTIPIQTSSCNTGPKGSKILNISDHSDSSGDENYLPPELRSMVAADDRMEDDLSGSFSQLGIQKGPFFGKSSGIRLLGRARTMMGELTGRRIGPIPNIPPERKAAFWDEKHPWQTISSQTDDQAKALRFPPEDLLNTLIALYFRHFHPTFPTLHLPTLRDQMERGLHKQNLSFGLQVLLVCAVGSRWSEDPRVCVGWDSQVLPGTKVDWHNAGWPFIEQIFSTPKMCRQTPRLHDLQNTILMAFSMQNTQALHSTWFIIGAGVRMAMDLGAHRRKAYRNDGSLEDEVWKRTFWCLVNFDRMTSTVLGRPPAINDEDIDAELPLEVDDASWDRPTNQSKQPDDQPSLFQGFNQLTKLLQITSFAVRTIYSNRKSKVHLGFVGDEWERHIVSKLDSSLNSWIDNIPSHLRWNPNITDPIAYDQSVILNIYYRQAQIVIHRPFLPGLSKRDSPLAYTSLAICSNAARSVSHIVDAYRIRKVASANSVGPLEAAKTTMPGVVGVAFLAGVVLLMAICDSKRPGANVDVTSLADDVRKITDYVKFVEARLKSAGKLWDAFQDLTSSGKFSETLGTGVPIERSGQKRRQAEPEANPQSDPPPSKEYSLTTANFAVPSLYNGPSSHSTSSWVQPHVYGIPIRADPDPLVGRRPLVVNPELRVHTNGVSPSTASNTPHTPAAWLNEYNKNGAIDTTTPSIFHAATPSAPTIFGLPPDPTVLSNHQANLPFNPLAMYEDMFFGAPEIQCAYSAGLQNVNIGENGLQPGFWGTDNAHSAHAEGPSSQAATTVQPILRSNSDSTHPSCQGSHLLASLTCHSNNMVAPNGVQNPDIWANSSCYDFTALLDADWNPFGVSIMSQAENQIRQ